MDHDGSTDPQLRSASISFVIPGLLLPELRELRLQGRQLLVDPVERRSETKRDKTRRNEIHRNEGPGLGGKNCWSRWSWGWGNLGVKRVIKGVIIKMSEKAFMTLGYLGLKPWKMGELYSVRSCWSFRCEETDSLWKFCHEFQSVLQRFEFGTGLLWISASFSCFCCFAFDTKKHPRSKVPSETTMINLWFCDGKVETKLRLLNMVCSTWSISGAVELSFLVFDHFRRFWRCQCCLGNCLGLHLKTSTSMQTAQKCSPRSPLTLRKIIPWKANEKPMKSEKGPGKNDDLKDLEWDPCANPSTLLLFQREIFRLPLAETAIKTSGNILSVHLSSKFW